MYFNNFYFPFENSFIIFEVENRFHTFTIILYGNKGNFEYKRLIFETEFKNIKHLLINSETDEIQNVNRKKLFSMIRQLFPDITRKALKDRQDVKEYLFSDTLRQDESINYCILHLRDIKENTFENYGVLIKSIYSATNMDNEKIRLISDINYIKGNIEFVSKTFSNQLSKNQKRVITLKDLLIKIDNENKIIIKHIILIFLMKPLHHKG